MLNIFPHLLSLTFFAPVPLRLAAAAAFAYAAYMQWIDRAELAEAQYPVIGRGGAWSIWCFIVFEAATALLLALGLLTQAAAILGILISIKYFIWYSRYPRLMVLARPTSALLFVICVSLLITGAGAYAFDIPL